MCRVPPASVWRQVLAASSLTAITRSRVAVGGQPGPTCLRGGERPDVGEIVPVGERGGPARRAGQRLVTAGREQAGPGVAAAGPRSPAGDEHRMGAFGAVDDAGGQPGAVIGAQHAGGRAGEGQVDQGLVPGRLTQLGGGAGLPGRLTHVADGAAAVGVGEGRHPRDDPRRVGTHLGHVGEAHPARLPAQVLAQQADLRAGHRHEHRVGTLQPPGHEAQHRAQVLIGAAVEHRSVLELRREDRRLLTHQ